MYSQVSVTGSLTLLISPPTLHMANFSLYLDEIGALADLSNRPACKVFSTLGNGR
jgi:hypothetical protein